MSLEELILRHSLGREVAPAREHGASGVMMIPIPKGGLLERVDGLESAAEVPGITEITISAHLGQELVPLPEGSRYSGFRFREGRVTGHPSREALKGGRRTGDTGFGSD